MPDNLDYFMHPWHSQTTQNQASAPNWGLGHWPLLQQMWDTRFTQKKLWMEHSSSQYATPAGTWDNICTLSGSSDCTYKGLTAQLYLVHQAHLSFSILPLKVHTGDALSATSKFLFLNCPNSISQYPVWTKTGGRKSGVSWARLAYWWLNQRHWLGQKCSQVSCHCRVEDSGGGVLVTVCLGRGLGWEGDVRLFIGEYIDRKLIQAHLC